MPVLKNTKWCECHLQAACADVVCPTEGPPTPSDFSHFFCALTPSPCASLFPNSPRGCMVGQACSSRVSCGTSLDPDCYYSCLDAPEDTVSTTGKTCQLVCQAGNPDHGGDHGGDQDGQGGGVSCPTGSACHVARARAACCSPPSRASAGPAASPRDTVPSRFT